jgi:hypothetical protein
MAKTKKCGKRIRGGGNFSIDEFKKLSQEEIKTAPYGWSFNPAEASIYRRESPTDGNPIEMHQLQSSIVVLVDKDTKKEITLTNTNFNVVSNITDDVSTTPNNADGNTTVSSRLRGVPYFGKNLVILLGDSIVNGKKELQIIPLNEGLPVRISVTNRPQTHTTTIIVPHLDPKGSLGGGSRRKRHSTSKRKSKHCRRTRKRKC